MSYWSIFYEIEVRDEIAQEFTDETGRVDDMMAGLHEIRARMAEQEALRGQGQATRAKQPRKHSQVKRLSRKQHKQRTDNRIPVL